MKLSLRHLLIAVGCAAMLSSDIALGQESGEAPAQGEAQAQPAQQPARGAPNRTPRQRPGAQAPANPVAPQAPAQPQQPVAPTAPANAQPPIRPSNPAQAQQPNRPGNPQRPDNANQPGLPFGQPSAESAQERIQDARERAAQAQQEAREQMRQQQPNRPGNPNVPRNPQNPGNANQPGLPFGEPAAEQAQERIEEARDRAAQAAQEGRERMRQQQPGETPSARDPRNPLNDGRPGVDPRRPDRRPEFDPEDEANFPPRPGSLGPRNTPDQIRRAADEAERMRRDDAQQDLRETVEDRLREDIPQETREAIRDAREAARDVTEDASETAAEIREDAREAIRDRRPALGYRPERYTPDRRYYPGDGVRSDTVERGDRVMSLRELIARRTNAAVLPGTPVVVDTPRRADWYRWQEYDRRHDDWLHGYWNDQRLQSRWTVYDRYPVARRVGLTFWGANALAYQFGYYNYQNPFYQRPVALAGGTTINYSRPLVVYQTSNATQVVSDRLPDAAQAQFDRARQAFAGRDYQAALVFINGALALAPDDSTLHEVRALVLFALGEYQEAAAPLYAVLSVRPGWDWATMRSFYATVPDYTRHLRELEVHQAENPSSAAASFVLAYHYLTMGHDQAAADQYRNVIANNENDYLSRSLLDTIVGNEPVGAPAGELTRREVRIQAEDLQGVWMAEGRSDSQYRLALGPDQTFRWTYTVGDESRTIEGIYALDGDTLAMEPDTGGVLLAEVTSPQNGSFDFRMIGAPPRSNDAALTFTIRR